MTSRALVEKTSTLLGKDVDENASPALSPLDEAGPQEAGGEGPKGLVRVERQLGETVHRSSGIAVDLAQRVPLHQADAERVQCRIKCTMMTMLDRLDEVPQAFERA